MKIIETDNHGSDYPDEKFINLPYLCKKEAEKICEAINDCLCRDGDADRFWRVVDDDYKLIGGFEP